MNALAQRPAVVEYSHVDVIRGKSILADFSWQTLPGEQWVIVGPNGAGKTTLMRLAAGLDYPNSGSVSIGGTDVSKMDSAEANTRIGYASAEVQNRILPDETSLGVVVSAAWGQSRRYLEDYEKQDNQRAADLLEAFGVGALAEQSFSTLSEGEKRRVLVARALMPDPEIVILDEPTAGLDLAGREILVAALREIMSVPSTPSFVLVTHELEEIPSTFTHALVLGHGGRVVAAGPIAETLNGANISEAFEFPLEVTFTGQRWWGRSAQEG